MVKNVNVRRGVLMLAPVCVQLLGGQVKSLMKLQKKKKEYLFAKLTYVVFSPIHLLLIIMMFQSCVFSSHALYWSVCVCGKWAIGIGKKGEAAHTSATTSATLGPGCGTGG